MELIFGKISELIGHNFLLTVDEKTSEFVEPFVHEIQFNI
jgi:hypothetical protein